MTAPRSIDGNGSPAARSPHRIFGSFLTAVAAVSAIAGYHGTAATARQHDTTSYTIRSHVRTLAVTAHLGDVRVSGGTAAAVTVTQHVVFHGAAPTIRHRLAAGTLTLTSHCPADEICSVSYDITVPRATAVRISDDVGTVWLSALAGRVTVLVDAGQVDLSSLSGPLQATTRAGSIIGKRVSSAHASLRVSTGEINVSFSAPPAALSATSDIGAVILRVPNVPYDVATSATVGHIKVTVTQDTSASRRITSSTRIGAIAIEPSSR